jgi:hypothetical protein
MKILYGILCIFLLVASTLSVSANLAPKNVVILARINAEDSLLPEKGTFNVLKVDGGWLEKDSNLQHNRIQYLREVALSGVPIAMQGGSLRFDDIIDNLTMRYSIARDILAQAIKVYPGVTLGGRLVCDQLLVTGENITGQRIEQSVLDWAVSKVFDEGVVSKTSMLSYGINSGVLFPTGGILSGSSSPAWTLQWTYTLLYLNNPHGDLNITHCWYYLDGSGSNTYSWFNLITEITSTPGIVGYSGSDWRTADIKNSVDLDYYGDPNLLVDHGPGDTSGSGTVTYNLGVTQGVSGARVTSKMSTSYSTQDVVIDDQSDSSKQLAYWYHDVKEDKDVGKNKYTAKPGVTIRYLPIAPFSIYTWHEAAYGHPVYFWWEYWNTGDIPLRIDFLGRDVNVIVVKATDSSSSWINNVNDVKSGVVEAANDATANSLVKFYGENIHVYEVTSTDQLFALALNPPLRAVVVNTHGEVIPMPGWYFGPSIHITAPTDYSTRYTASFTISADVYPPPGYSLQQSQNSIGQYSYVWYKWVRSSNGATNGWSQMNPQSS